MAFVIKTHFYGGFKASETSYKSYDNLLEGWNEYKRLRAFDFDYGDSFHSTTYFISHDYSVQLKPQRPHARSYRAWLELQEQRNKLSEFEEILSEVITFDDLIAEEDDPFDKLQKEWFDSGLQDEYDNSIFNSLSNEEESYSWDDDWYEQWRDEQAALPDYGCIDIDWDAMDKVVEELDLIYADYIDKELPFN